jgi:predicted acylesterase/phospholipase RssA
MKKTTLIIDCDLNKLMAAIGAYRGVLSHTRSPQRLIGIGGGAVLVALITSGQKERLEKLAVALNEAGHGLMHPETLPKWLSSVLGSIPADEALTGNLLIAADLSNGQPVIFPHDVTRLGRPNISLANAATVAARPPWHLSRFTDLICDGRLCNTDVLKLQSSNTNIRIFTEIDRSTPLHGLESAIDGTAVLAGQYAQMIRNKSSEYLPSSFWEEMIIIHTDICPTRATLDSTQLDMLFKEGRIAAEEFFTENREDNDG